MDKLQEYYHIAIDKIVFFTPRVVAAALVFWIGFKLIKKILGLLDKTLAKMSISDTMRPFLLSIISVILKISILFVIVTIIGVDLSGLLAILAAVGFAIGMSLQGSLGNFASGILIMFLKPYEAGDWIQVGDSFGKVQEIGIFSTVVITPGDKVLIIPNAKITDDVVANYSRKGVVRLEVEVTMPYSEDFPKVEKIIKDTLQHIPLVLEEPAAQVGIETFDSHSIVIAVRPYVKPDDFWEATFRVHSDIKNAFNQHGVQVAYSEGVELGKIGA